MPPEKISRQKELERLFKRIAGACGSSPSFKGLTPVFGVGPAPSEIMVVGEAPGRTETKMKEPFVGRAGSFFVSILEKTLKRKKGEVYITNVVKVWPTIKTKRLKTRKPTTGEEEFFMPFLLKEIDIVRPGVIIAVGKTAFKALLPDEEFKRGVWFRGPRGVAVIPIYHPSYILRRHKDREKLTDEFRASLKKVIKRLEDKKA